MRRAVLLALSLAAATASAAPRVGFVVHFDCLEDEREARQAVRIAAENGAEVLSVVPPAHVWESQQASAMLDAVVGEASRRGLRIVFARIDAAFPRDRHGRRENYLYARILTEPGRMPDGSRTADFFLTTAGRRGYVEWMEEETRYYAQRFGRLPNLIGISLGPFVEPFASERGGFLQYSSKTDRYELTQYTPEAEWLWHAWLAQHIGDVSAINAEYGTHFESLALVPLPKSDEDDRFGRPQRAYFDFVRTLNDWFVAAYARCRNVWHEVSGRNDVPFILQFSGLEAEKIAKGRPGLAAFDLPRWVAEADAVGLSLYSNGGYPDHGHASIRAVVRLVDLAHRNGRDTFVLESGYEAPNVRASRRELEFLAAAPQALQPRTWIYEFLKDKFDEQYRSNPGKLVAADGRIRPAAQSAVRRAFAIAHDAAPEKPEPALRIFIDPMAARDDRRLALLANGLFDLASVANVQWMSDEKDADVKVRPGLVATDPTLEELLSVPEPGDERTNWAQRVLHVIGH